MNPPSFADACAVAPEPAPAGARPFVPSGFASIDRILQAPVHPVEARYLRGEATIAELLAVPSHDEDSGVTIEELIAWLRGRGPGRESTG